MLPSTQEMFELEMQPDGSIQMSPCGADAERMFAIIIEPSDQPLHRRLKALIDASELEASE